VLSLDRKRKSLVSLQPAPLASEVAIWERIIRPENADLTPEAARFFLDLSFASSDLARMRDLVQKQQRVDLSPSEESDLLAYRKVGLQLDLLRSKARRVIGVQPKTPELH
jgi:hypothetical protein